MKQPTALPISTKINAAGMYKTAGGTSKPITQAQSPLNKGTGLDDPATTSNN